MLQQRNILLAVSGGIAAYKACELVRLLLKHHARVQVAMTPAATRFIAPLTFEALTGQPVALDLFAGEESGRGHLDLVRDIDLMVMAPATANCLGKLANGIADDLISTATLALDAPLLLCPAMNPRMWQHPAVQENLQKLRDRGVYVLAPEAGPMAHPQEDPGVGRLPEPLTIFHRICELLPPRGRLNGLTLTITAGPTREALDPVRFISNYSSGTMGYALAQAARVRGAEVILITGPSSLPPPPGVRLIYAESTTDLLKATQRAFKSSQALIMAAAPTDFQASEVAAQKIKKDPLNDTLTLKLTQTPDILKSLSKNKGSRLLIGFALETESGQKNARRKMQEKNLDLIVLNHPRPNSATGMARAAIQATILFPDGRAEEFPQLPKEQFAERLLDRLESLFTERHLLPVKA